MSARSPFRSHLLQQWTNSRRSPIVVQQWLQQATIDEEEEVVRPRDPSRASRHRRESSRRSLHHSSRQQSQPSLSSVDTSPSSISLAAASWAASLKHGQNEEDIFIEDKDAWNMKTALRDMASPQNVAANEYGMTNAPSIKNKIHDLEQHSESSTFTSTQKDQGKHRRDIQLSMAIERAISMAKATNLHNRHQIHAEEEPPLTFQTLFPSSRSGRRLVDICFEVMLRTTLDDDMARKKRERWSEASAFLVATVHNNQREIPGSTEIEKKTDDGPYKALSFSPPINEGQLGDYASACAAVQSAIHSFNGDGLRTEWINDTLIKTPAFRSLIQAKPTDRIAALVMVHDSP